MTMDWLPLIHPLELFGVLALTSVCLLYAFLLHLSMQTMARRARDQRNDFEGRLAQVMESIETLRAAPPEAVARPVPAPVAGQPLNLNKRGQVLRMRRRGENPETIAAALSIPRNEVDLLLKVHQMALQQVDKGSIEAVG